MNEKDFLYTLKEYLKVEGQFTLLNLLKNCELRFNYTNVFADKNWQFRAYIDIRVPIQIINEVKTHKNKLTHYCSEIFIDDEQYAFYGVDIKPLIITSNNENLSKCINNYKEKEIKSLNDKTLQAIAEIITGDNGKSIYKKGYELVNFFNNFGFNDVYGPGFPSRIVYTKNKLTELNNNGKISEILEEALDPRDYIENEELLTESITYLNKFLKYDDLMLSEQNNLYKLTKYIPSNGKTPQLPDKNTIKTCITTKKETKEINVFISYSHEDEELLNRLEKHLSLLKRKGIINTWHDKNIDAGSNIDNSIDENLKSSQIILLLISADFLASDYCYDIEMKEALRMNDTNQAVVVPIILKPCYWKTADFSKLKVLPNDGKSVVTWAFQDEAFLNIVQGIENIALKF